MTRPAFIWVDLETTGLDPVRDVILEVAIITTDAAFRPLARGGWLVVPNELERRIAEMPDVVRQMHGESGLLEDLRCRQYSLANTPGAVRYGIQCWLEENAPVPERYEDRPPMAGNTVNFDRAFFAHHMPNLRQFFHHRSLDVSTLKVLAVATVPGAREWEAARGKPAHRGMDDIEASIEELAHWREVLKHA